MVEYQQKREDKYKRFLVVRAVPDYSSVDGLLKLYFTRKDEDGISHFLLLTVWEFLDAIRKFAGDDPELAKYYPEDDEYLLEKKKYVQHYTVFYEK